MKLIDKSALVTEIERRIKELQDLSKNEKKLDSFQKTAIHLCIEECKVVLNILNTLEVKEVDLEKLGEIARHLIAVKEHIEDMLLDKEEWFILEKIGYPERFKAQKGE